jgi:hypothetical protein
MVGSSASQAAIAACAHAERGSVRLSATPRRVPPSRSKHAVPFSMSGLRSSSDEHNQATAVFERCREASKKWHFAVTYLAKTVQSENYRDSIEAYH